MKFDKINSLAKINLSLNVIKRLPNKYHKIESLISFVNFFDEIKIRETNKSKNKISFSGKFGKNIGKNNTIFKLLKLLEKKIIQNKKFEVKIKKNIPPKSGMGGGSMNAASILKYLMKKNFLNISNNQAKKIAYRVGSDVILGLEKKNSILFKNGKIGRLKKTICFHVLIVMPNFGCSTKRIFSEVKKFSKSIYSNTNKSYFSINNLLKSNNDLERVVLKKYSKTKKLKHFLSKLPKVIFVRMTGSGSAFVAYFKFKNSAKNAAKIFENKYKGYWFTVSKTI